MISHYTRPIAEQVAHLRTLKDGWDSYGAAAPTQESIDRAWFAYQLVRMHHLPLPRGICPAGEGGAAIFFHGPDDAYADVAFLNDGTCASWMILSPRVQFTSTASVNDPGLAEHVFRNVLFMTRAMGLLRPDVQIPWRGGIIV